MQGPCILLGNVVSDPVQSSMLSLLFRYEDNFDAVNNLTIISQPADKGSVDAYGSPEQFLDKISFLFGKQTFTGAALCLIVMFQYAMHYCLAVCAFCRGGGRDLLPDRQADLTGAAVWYQCPVWEHFLLSRVCVHGLLPVQKHTSTSVATCFVCTPHVQRTRALLCDVRCGWRCGKYLRSV
jgi:hypothetical protein